MAPKPSRMTSRISSDRLAIRRTAAATEPSTARRSARAVHRLMREGLHGAQPVQRLLRHGAEIGDALLRRARQPLLPPAEQHQRHDHQRHHQRDDAGQLRAGHQQHPEGARAGQRVAQPMEMAEPISDCSSAYRRSGGRGCRRSAPSRTRPATARQHMLEHVPPQVARHPLAEPGDQPEAPAGGQRQGGDHGEQHQRGAVQRRGAAGGEALSTRCRSPWPRPSRPGGQQQRRDGGQQHAAAIGRR